MTRETVEKMLRDAIADESRLDNEFHKGRVHALRFALELLGEIDPPPWWLHDAWPIVPATRDGVPVSREDARR
jgi:hypothetical protein